MKINRRTVIRTFSVFASGIAFASSAFAQDNKKGQAKKQIEESNYTLRNTGESLALAKFISNTTYQDLTPSALAMAKRSILDAVGVSLGASGLEPSCQPFIDQALEMKGAGVCSVFGFKEKVPTELAALANGSMAHALDYEDAHEASRTHPNAASIPAAFALAEELNKNGQAVTGEEFITAIALGCDIACRLILAGDPKDNGGRRDGFYPPAVVGSFSACIAAAKLLKLNEEQILDALSLTLCRTSFSAELIDSPRSHLRAVREAFGSQTAISSVQLAEKGVKGFDRPFEGNAGYYNMYGSGFFDSDILVGGLGDSYHGETISFKAWPACRASHAYIQAILALKRETKVRVENIESIKVAIIPEDTMLFEPAENKVAPLTAIDAKFSLPFTVATALLSENVTLESFTPEALNNKQTLGLAKKVSYEINANKARITANGSGDLFEIRMKDGKVYKRSVKRVYGNTNYPLPDEVLLKKFLDCGSHAATKIPISKLQTVATRIMSLEQEKNVGNIIATLTPA